MESIYIHGGIALQGQVRVQGSKNAVLPVMAATLLTEGTSTIGNCPRLKDVYHMQTLLESLGCVTARDKEMLKVHAANVSTLRAGNALVHYSSGRIAGQAWRSAGGISRRLRDWRETYRYTHRSLKEAERAF